MEGFGELRKLLQDRRGPIGVAATCESACGVCIESGSQFRGSCKRVRVSANYGSVQGCGLAVELERDGKIRERG